MQPAGVAEPEHRAAHARRVVARAAERRRAEREEDARQHDVVAHHLAQRRTEYGRQRERRELGLTAAARDRPEVLLDERARLRGIEVAGDGEHGVVGRVPRREELGHVVERRGVEVLHRADERVVEGMVRRVAERGELLPPRAVGLVVHRPAALVLHHVALRVELLLRHRGEEAPHAVGLEPERELELVRRQRLEVVRAVEPGRAVERPAGALHELEVLVRRDVGRALEEHVLEQVSEPGATGTLVGRADVVPEIHRDDRRGVIFGQGHPQPVGELERLDGNAHERMLRTQEARRYEV